MLEELKELGMLGRKGKPRRRRSSVVAMIFLLPLIVLCSAAGFGAGVAWEGKNSTRTLPYADALRILETESAWQRVLSAASVVQFAIQGAIQGIAAHVDDPGEYGANIAVVLKNIAKKLQPYPKR